MQSNRAIKPSLIAIEAFLLSSHISCIYTIITFIKKKRFEAAESGGLTAPIAGNWNQDPNADTAG